MQKKTDEQSAVTVGPNTHLGSHFITSITPNEVIITFGTTRIGFNPNGQSGHVVDWFTSIALHPTVAKQLIKSISDGLAADEKTPTKN